MKLPNARRWSMALAAAAVLTTTGCGSAAPIQTPQAEVTGGNAGVDTPVGDNIKVLDVELPYPLDGVYQAGDDAPLYLAISNIGTTDDVLIDVKGPDFAGVQGPTADGHLALPVQANNNVYVGAEGAPTLTLMNLATSLHSSQRLAVTLTFRDAGSVTVQAVVAAEGQDPRKSFDFPSPAKDPSGG